MKKFLPKTTNNPYGFTLVELLVVVSIIAILTVIGITVFGNIQIKARDSRRKADIDAVSKALEAHYNDSAACAVTATAPYCPPLAAWFSNNVIPANPSPGGAAYTGAPTSPAATYNVCATLEVADPVTGSTYCRKNQQ